MDENKFRLVCRSICRVSLIICVTILAIYFKDTRILWWWVIPAFLMNGLFEQRADSTVSTNEDKETQNGTDS